MFKEVVISGAIILGFLINIAFVAHPDTTSYTIAFVISLIVLSPFVLWWRYGATKRALREAGSVEEDEEISLRSLSVGQLLGLNSATTPVLDAEQGMGWKIIPSDETSGSADAEGSGSMHQDSPGQPELES
ncbi:hypothetical protein LOCC1_G001496 [Lachnellula occidentalis]|uniref:Uncharacterized protein n=1 Tax=Lachnellula occidentalis TaxID=215460 RepID=A0A8H8S842_9HELO|nr:hypothetical protein LOCC1_G001496 [Lachnellula occidentalis]